MGNIALAAGFLLSLFMVSPEEPEFGAYVLAALLVLAGLGLRVEAAILAVRGQGEAG